MLFRSLVEVLIDCHHEAILDAFLDEMRTNRGLRQACSCAAFRLPDALAQRIYDLIGSDDDIGRQRS